MVAQVARSSPRAAAELCALPWDHLHLVADMQGRLLDMSVRLTTLPVQRLVRGAPQHPLDALPLHRTLGIVPMPQVAGTAMASVPSHGEPAPLPDDILANLVPRPPPVPRPLDPVAKAPTPGPAGLAAATSKEDAGSREAVVAPLVAERRRQDGLNRLARWCTAPPEPRVGDETVRRFLRDVNLFPMSFRPTESQCLGGASPARQSASSSSYVLESQRLSQFGTEPEATVAHAAALRMVHAWLPAMEAARRAARVMPCIQVPTGTVERVRLRESEADHVRRVSGLPGSAVRDILAGRPWQWKVEPWQTVARTSV